jgi:uncharacterized membrane protein (GlpM family)
MTTNLLIQIIVSFLAGGALVTLLSLLAEKSNPHISGIIMMFPTTLVLGFFFLGLTSSADHVAHVIPSLLIPLGFIVFSSLVYINCSLLFQRYIGNKALQILCALLSSSIIWFILVSPFAIYKFSNLGISIIGFITIIISTHLILRNKGNYLGLLKPNYTRKQMFFRACFNGSIIAVVVLLGKTLNTFWGGIFTMYPAATFATLVILHFYYEPKYLFNFVKSMPLGSISLFTYSVAVMFLFPKFGVWLGTLISYLIAMTIGLLLTKWKHQQDKRTI